MKNLKDILEITDNVIKESLDDYIPYDEAMFDKIQEVLKENKVKFEYKLG